MPDTAKNQILEKLPDAPVIGTDVLQKVLVSCFSPSAVTALRAGREGLVIGEDNLAIFTQWREYEFILANFRIFVYPRASSRQTGGVVSAEKGFFRTMPIKEIRFLSEAPYFNISSTELRQRGNCCRR